MARLSCGVQNTRMILLILNIIFLILGFIILGLGIYIKANGNFNAITAVYHITQALGSPTMQWTGTILIIIGSFTTCLAAFGCLGAFYRNRLFLYVYAVILSLIILLEFAAVIASLQYRNDLWVSYDSGFEEVFLQAYRNNQTDMIEIIEELEIKFQCCGVNGYSDYTKYAYKIPLSCHQYHVLNGALFSLGCAEAIGLWVWKQLPIIAGVLGSILFIEVFCVISSLVLGVAISHSNIDTYYKL